MKNLSLVSLKLIRAVILSILTMLFDVISTTEPPTSLQFVLCTNVLSHNHVSPPSPTSMPISTTPTAPFFVVRVYAACVGAGSKRLSVSSAAGVWSQHITHVCTFFGRVGWHLHIKILSLALSQRRTACPAMRAAYTNIPYIHIHTYTNIYTHSRQNCGWGWYSSYYL